MRATTVITEIPDLWGDDIRVDVVTPLVLLKAQSAAIQRKTQGVLSAQITTSEVMESTDGSAGTVPQKRCVHALDLVAPALDYRETILEVVHDSKRPYPAVVYLSEMLDTDVDDSDHDPRDPLTLQTIRTETTAYSASELIPILRRALQSRNTRAVIDSLLAMSNERG